jgi:uncharacterized protein DUF4349
VIRTGTISLVIPRGTFGDRYDQAVAIATDNQGYVQTSRSQQRSGSLTMRIPAANFDAAMTALRALGEVQVESIHGEDVTAQYVDLNARLRIAKSRREVLLGLMEDAKTIAQTIHVQNALDQTQLRIEEIQGQLNYLNDQTSLATVTVSLREEGVQAVHKPSIPNAFERAIAGFVAVIAGIVIGLGYLLPILLIAAVAWVVARRRRHRERA